jgi:hypothetical protein
MEIRARLKIGWNITTVPTLDENVFCLEAGGWGRQQLTWSPRKRIPVPLNIMEMGEQLLARCPGISRHRSEHFTDLIFVVRATGKSGNSRHRGIPAPSLKVLRDLGEDLDVLVYANKRTVVVTYVEVISMVTDCLCTIKLGANIIFYYLSKLNDFPISLMLNGLDIKPSAPAS